jgi:hypothetical protein
LIYNFHFEPIQFFCIDNVMNRRSYSFNLGFLRRNKPTEYFYIQDYENTNERFCKKCDKNNDMIYARNMSLYTRTKKFLEKNNAIFKMEGPPDPPRVPSNYELFVIHKNRNSHTNNKIQTMAILFLLQQGYKLVIDPAVEFIPKVMNRENKLFEPYMAISLASAVNKNFVKGVAKYYEMRGERIESPELLSIEEKIHHYDKHGVIEYLDVSSNEGKNMNKLSTSIINVPKPTNEVISHQLSAQPSAQPSAPPPLNEKEQTVEQFSEPVPISPTAPESSYPLISELSSLVSNPPPYGSENTAPDNRKGINIFINK